MLDDVFAAVLVGGGGQRLGGIDKAMLHWPDGTTLLERLVTTLRPAVREVVLVGRSEQSYASIDCRLLADTRAAAGPLVGLETALNAEIAPWCFLIACDMPYAGIELVQYLAAHRTHNASVVIPMTDAGLEPTAALYAASCRDPIRAALDDGQRAMHKVVQSLTHDAVRVPAKLHSQLANVNTSEDLVTIGIE